MGRNKALQTKKQAKLWLWAGLWISLAAGVSYGLNLILGPMGSLDSWKLMYGIAATLFLFGVAGWAVRRRTMRFTSKLGLGSSRAWLYFHIYGGLLFLLLVFLHSGFGIPSGMLNLTLWLLCLWTVLSGLAGLALQRWIPRVLASGLSIEVLYERIPQLIEELGKKAEAVVAQAEEPIQAFYARNLANSFSQPRHRFIFFLDITGGIKSRLRRFEYLRNFLSEEGRGSLNQLERLYKTKLEIDAHYTLQQPLRWWLVAHVPTSWMMLAMVGLHIFTVFYY